MHFMSPFKNFLLAAGATALFTSAGWSSTTLDTHSGLQFTSGGVTYLGLKVLEHEDGIGSIWEAIRKNHDLETGPEDLVLVLAPDILTPVGLDLDDFEAVTLDRHSGLQFTSGGVDYIGLWLLEHEDGVGTIWEAIPKNHDLESSPVYPRIVLAPDVVTPLSGDLAPNTYEALMSNQESSFHDPEFEAATTLDNHSGLEFTSGGVDYIGLEILEHEDGVGTIWLAIPKNHDLETGPVDFHIVLAPDVVTPVAASYGPFGDLADNYWEYLLLLYHSRRRGDLNVDGCVSSADFLMMLQHFGQSGSVEHGDLNRDGMISIDDFAILQQNFHTCIEGIEPVVEDAQGQEIAQMIGTWPFLPDSDGDGVLDAFEDLKGSDAQDASDHLRITRIEITGGDLALEWRSVAGVAYGIERSESSQGGSWIAVGTEPIPAQSQSTMRSVPIQPANASAVFYRIRALPN